MHVVGTDQRTMSTDCVLVTIDHAIQCGTGRVTNFR